jgi:hypothetical protein
MAKRKRTKGLTMIYKVIHIVLTIEQQEPTQIRWWTEVPRDCKQFLLYWWHPTCSPFVTTTFIIVCHISNSYFWLNMVISKDDQIEQRSRDSEQQCAKNNTNLGKRLVRWRYIVNAYIYNTCALSKHIGNMCMRLRNGRKARVCRAFSHVSRRIHIFTYMLRQCTCIVFILQF